MADRPRPVTEPVAVHGEGPVWVPAWGGLHCVDLLAGDILAVEVATGSVTRHRVGTVAATVRPRAGGGAVVAVERGFLLVDSGGPDDPSGLVAGARRPLGELWGAADGRRMNDGGCDPDGRFYCGSMAYDERRGAGSLYRLEPDRTHTAVLAGVTVSNGLAWSPDSSTAYYVDTPTLRVDAFDYDLDRGLTGRRPLVTVPPGVGEPDGIAVDAEGGLWVALWGGGAVRRYTPAGRLDGVVRLPVPRVTACTFGGEALSTLYVTTSRVATDLDRHPEAGALYAVDVGVGGLPVQPFAG